MSIGLFDCPYATCIYPRCLTDGGTAVCYPLCASEDWRVRQDIAKRATVQPRARAPQRKGASPAAKEPK